MIISRKITIISNVKPIREEDLNEEIKWLCNSLGLFTLRDKDSSCYRIFIELLKSSKAHNALSSDELAYHLGLSRGTVMHHIDRLMESGIVISEKRRYRLRIESLEVLIRELERDMERTFQDLKEMAKRIDRELGL